MSKLLKDGQSVKNLYLRFTGMEAEKQVLNKLKMRFYHTSNEDVCLIQHHREKKTHKIKKDWKEPKHIGMKVYDNFQEVMRFQSSDPELLVAVCNTIWRHNLDEDNEVFMVFTPRVLDRAAACLKIQNSFRSFLRRKR